MCYLRTKLHTSSSCSSLVTATERKAEEKIPGAAKLLIYIPKITDITAAECLSTVFHHASLYDLKVSVSVIIFFKWPSDAYTQQYLV
jgi:hypothetical protein